MIKPYDVIIIGTGAGGGTLAWSLAKTGKRILILERGDFLPREVQNWDSHEVFTKGRYRPQEDWYDINGKPFQPFTHYCVGGNTKVYGAALLRLRESDFEEVRHVDGLSPAWPLPYAAFEPYYQQAEKLYSVHGQAGADPKEPWRSQDYPYHALPFEPDMAELNEHFQGIGLQPAPIPIGIRLPDDRGRSKEATRVSYFDGYPDPTEMKADSHVVGIKAALQWDNVELIRAARVVKLMTDPSGQRITKVIADCEGQLREFEGDMVVLACGAINSAALLLASANAKHPHGLANRSGQVGRNLMLHNNGALLAITTKANNASFQKSILISEFYDGTERFPYPAGAIQLMGKTDPDTLRGLLEDQFGRDWSYDLTYYSRHTIDFFITAEDLPVPENRVLLRPDGSIQLQYQPNNLKAYEELRSTLIQILDQVNERGDYGITGFMGYKLGISGVSHQSGTCRFGTDPNTSVLDLNCKAHDLDNLYVVDTSFFPSSGAVNPSLTAMANALRVGDHLAARMACSQAEAMMAVAL